MLRYALKKHLCLSLALLVLLSFPVLAKKTSVSLEDASEQVRKESKGKIISARTTNFDGIKSHRIQVLTPSGRIKIYQIPVNNKSNTTKNNKYYSNNKNQNTRQNSTNYSNQSNYRQQRQPNTYVAPKNSTTSAKGATKEK